MRGRWLPKRNQRLRRVWTNSPLLFNLSQSLTRVEDDVDFSPDPPKEDGDVTNPSTALPSEQKEPGVSTSTTEKPTTDTAAKDPPATDTTANAPPADPSDPTAKKRTLGLSAPAAIGSTGLVAPYRAILRYYRCDTPYRAILFQGG